jgi:hypothetical protein
MRSLLAEVHFWKGIPMLFELFVYGGLLFWLFAGAELAFMVEFIVE